ncbi:MAG: TMEM175 family protein [bacterium]|nr:TMEM175 family protein [bacterium]
MPRHRLFAPERLLAFSDGVVAIAITLLVLGLEVPSVHDVPEKELPAFLLDSAHALLSYVVSFVVIGTYWLQHYIIFHYVERVDRWFVLLNGLFLLTISFIPFPTGLQSVYRYDALAVVIYGGANMLCSLSLLAIWNYATKDFRLIAKDTPAQAIFSLKRRIAVTLAICLAAILLSFVNVLLSKLLFLTIPGLFFLHRVEDEKN